MALTSPYTGRRSGIGLSKESSRGVTGASVDYWLPFAAYSFNEKVQKVRDDSGFSVIETPRTADIVKAWNEGDIEFNVRDLSFGLILLNLFGTETFATNTPESGVGQHTFTVAQSNQHQSLSVYKKTPIETLVSTGCMINQFQLRAVLDQYVRCNIGLMGKMFAADSAAISYVTENRFRPQDVQVKIAATANELAGASVQATMRSMTITVNKNVQEYQGLSSVTPVDFVNRGYEVRLEFELALETTTFKNYTLLNQLRAMSIKLINNDVIIGTSTKPNLELILDQIDFDPFDIDEALENVAIIKMTGIAHYNQTNSRMWRAILQNGRNSAY